MKETNDSIDCHVDHCKYNSEHKCTLDKILVDTCGDEEHVKEDTMCDSYEAEEEEE